MSAAEAYEQHRAAPARTAAAVSARTVVLGCAAVAAGIAVAALVGWAVGAMSLASLEPHRATMKPQAAVAVLVSAAGLLALAQGRRAVVLVSGGLTAAVGVVILIEHAMDAGTGFDLLLLRGHLLAGDHSGTPGRASVLTSITLVLVGVALLLVPGLPTVATVAAIAAAVPPYLSVLGHLYDSPSFYAAGSATSMPVSTSIAGFALALGVMAAATRSRLVAIVLDRGPAGFLLRWVLPIGVLVPLVMGWLRLFGQRRGWYGTELGLALMTAGATLLIVGLALAAACRLRAVDRERAQTLAELENRVVDRTAALERQTTRLEALLRAVPVGIIQHAADGRVLWLNERAAEFAVVGASGRTGDWAVAVHPDDKDEVEDVLVQATRAGEPYVARARVRVPDGSYRPMAVEAHPLLGEAGATSWLAVVVDLTAVEAAEDHSAHLAAIVESSGDAIYRRDLDGTITAWNAGAEALLGWSADEIVGRSVLDLLPDEQRAVARAALRERVDEASTIPLYEMRHKDGHAVDVAATVTPVVLADGAVVGVAAILRDVSAERSARRALEAYAADLERSNTELEDYAYIASHDLSEPLHVVGGYASILEARYPPGTTMDERGAEIVDTISAAVERMRALIDDLLTYSRLGRAAPSAEPVELDAVLSGVRRDLAAQLASSGSRVTVDRLPVVSGDHGLLAQLFGNLLSNAVKFRMPGQPAQVHVSATRDGDTWRISVRDDGIGIKPDYHDRVFAMFRRLHTQDEYGGTGIGLAIVRRVAELHGGTVELVSDQSAGSTFVVVLPARAEPTPATRDETASPARSGDESMQP